MGELQKELEKAVQRLSKPLAVCKHFLNVWFKKKGLQVSKSELTAIARKVLDAMAGPRLTDTESVVIDLDVSSEIGQAVAELFGPSSEGFFAEAETAFLEQVEKGTTAALETISANMADNLAISYHETLIHQRSLHIEFEQRLYRRWYKGLDLLEVFIAVATEAGEMFLGEIDGEGGNAYMAGSDGHLVVEVLYPLHAKACRIASEALTLLKSGFADGAHARWRSLHEIAVVALFLADRGRQVQDAYLEHAHVERNKAAKKYQEHYDALGMEPFSESELADMQSRAIEAIQKHGKAFKCDYGWAAAALAKDRVTFADIEKSLDMSMWRPYYKMACHSIHAGAQSLWFSLGTGLTEEPIALSGRSNAGLADPGHSIAVSLAQATNALLGARPNADSTAVCGVLLHLSDAISEAFFEAHCLLEDEEGQSDGEND